MLCKCLYHLALLPVLEQCFETIAEPFFSITLPSRVTKYVRGDVLLFEEVIDDAGEYYIFDFQIGKVIISASDDFIQEDDIVGEADELIKEEIGNLFDLYDVYTWSVEKKKEYDINVMDDGYANWSINIKFSNNEVYVLSGNGINDEYAPEDLDLFVEDLKALATSSATENS